MGDELIAGSPKDMLVECYAGYEYPQRPAALLWQGKRLVVQQIQGEWRTPEGKKFRACMQDGQVFDLSYSALYDEWRIDPV